MDGLKLIRKQDVQDNGIASVTTEVVNARESIKQVYPTLKARLDAIDTNADNIQNNINQVVAGLQWKASVPSLNDIAVTYPNPEEGWTVSTDDTNIVYRYDEVTATWQPISSNSIGNAVANGNAGLMTGADKAKLDGLNANDYVKKTGDTINGQLTVTGGIVGDLTGNADSATKLQNPVTINGVQFDGSQNIVVADNTKLPLTGGTLTGVLNANGGINGNLTGNASTATRLQNPVNVTVGGSTKPFDGGGNLSFSLQEIGASPANHNHDNLYLKLTGGTLTGDVNTNSSINFTSNNTGIKHNNNVIISNNGTSTIIGSINNSIFLRPQGYFTTANQVTIATNGDVIASRFVGNLQGNSDTATRLATPRTINGVQFDGSQNIVVADNTKLPLTGGVITGSLTVNNGITGSLNGNATSATRLQTGRTINGVLFDGTSNINIGVNTGTTTLGGYTKPTQGGAITANDTLNQAFGKIEVNLDGKAPLNHTHTSNNVTALTGYVKGTNATAITANDTLNQAIAKLENKVDAKPNSIGRLTRLTRNENINANTNTVNIGLAYDTTTDILNVYLSGVRLQPTTEYTFTNTQITGVGGTTFTAGDVVSFEIIKIQ